MTGTELQVTLFLLFSALVGLSILTGYRLGKRKTKEPQDDIQRENMRNLHGDNTR